MALPGSGTIWISQLRDEFGNWGPPNYLSHYYRGGLTTANNTGVPAGGYISLAHFHGAQRSVAGSWSRTSPGTYSFTVPPYSTMRIDVRGAGGGGGGSTYDAGAAGSNGAAGGAATVSGTSLRGNGGSAGQGSYYNKPAKATNGSASGGNVVNTTGGGADGGVGGTYGATKGGDGGDGGRAVSDYGPGAIAPGTVLTVTVPTGGNGGAGQVAGAKGGNGAVYISWT
ncbi:hypothetical protein Dolphis_34 [Pseudomonas phage Dolphis]|nr:hypothetical protein Dolphis_34 [Pseudomonas phage Dolphis]